MEWKTIDRPGYMGDARDELVKEWNKEHGQGNWRLAYQWGDLVLPRELGIQIYEDAYYEFLRGDSDTLDWLVQNYSEVWDTAESNVDSRFDYRIQETNSSHMHDISIRRAVMRLGRWFQGNNLLHVRWTESEGYRLNPGVVKFHKPELILKAPLKNASGKRLWWYENTIEDFYQRNKLLQAKV